MTAVLHTISCVSVRRRAQIERELRVLRSMEGHLLTKEIAWAVLTIPAVAALVILVAVKAQWLTDSPLIAIIAALASGAVVWWIGGRWFVLSVIIVYGLVLILLEDVPDVGDTGDGAKEQRRVKLERAIARREALLARMDGLR